MGVSIVLGVISQELGFIRHEVIWKFSDYLNFLVWGY